MNDYLTQEAKHMLEAKVLAQLQPPQSLFSQLFGPASCTMAHGPDASAARLFSVPLGEVSSPSKLLLLEDEG